jgi:hypothetical protein
VRLTTHVRKALDTPVHHLRLVLVAVSLVRVRVLPGYTSVNSLPRCGSALAPQPKCRANLGPGQATPTRASPVWCKHLRSRSTYIRYVVRVEAVKVAKRAVVYRESSQTQVVCIHHPCADTRHQQCNSCICKDIVICLRSVLNCKRFGANERMSFRPIAVRNIPCTKPTHCHCATKRAERSTTSP